MVPNVRDFLEAKYTVSGAADNRNLCRSTSGIYPFSDFGEDCIIRKNHANQVGYEFRRFKTYVYRKNSYSIRYCHPVVCLRARVSVAAWCVGAHSIFGLLSTSLFIQTQSTHGQSTPPNEFMCKSISRGGDPRIPRHSFTSAERFELQLNLRIPHGI